MQLYFTVYLYCFNNEIFYLFSKVLNLETRDVVEDFTLNAARLPEHRNLNRYRDVLPCKCLMNEKC